MLCRQPMDVSILSAKIEKEGQGYLLLELDKSRMQRSDCLLISIRRTSAPDGEDMDLQWVIGDAISSRNRNWLSLVEAQKFNR